MTSGYRVSCFRPADHQTSLLAARKDSNQPLNGLPDASFDLLNYYPRLSTRSDRAPQIVEQLPAEADLPDHRPAPLPVWLREVR